MDLTVGLALAPQPCEPSTEVCACHFLRSLYGQVGPKHFGKMVQLLKASTALASNKPDSALADVGFHSSSN